jgi:hypothetical protein
MILDLESMFSDDQALTVTAVSTNVIDLGATGTPPLSSTALTRDLGPGTPIDILIQLTVASGGTSPTLIATLQKDTVENFASAEVVAVSATLVAGAVGDRLSIQWIPDGADQRYLRLNYTLAGTNPTYTVTAGIVLGRQTRPY